MTVLITKTCSNSIPKYLLKFQAKHLSHPVGEINFHNSYICIGRHFEWGDISMLSSDSFIHFNFQEQLEV